MPGMPRRPREHVLESVSRNRFRSQIEFRGWVVRSIDHPDYGLDDQVEIFLDEEATGLTFTVQARATDQEDLDHALNIRLRAEQQNYFAAQNDPVLLVRHHAPSDRLFAQWFHRVDSYPGNPSSTIRFDESMELTEDAIDALPREITLVRRIRAANVDWPMTLQVCCSDSRLSRDLTIAMSALADRHVLRLTEAAENHEPRFTVNVEADRLAVHGGLASVTLHGVISSADVECLAANGLLGVAVALASIGQTRAAAAVAARSAPVASSLENGEILLRLAGALARGREVRAAVMIGRSLIARGRLPLASFLTPIAALAAGDHLEEDDIAAVSEFLVELAKEIAASGDANSAAAASYSAANWLSHSAHDYPAALDWYCRAAELDGSYLNRNYYRQERAAALFECGDFLDSADWYRLALESGEADPRAMARRADALMFAGHYQEALAEFEAYTQAPDPAEPVWLAKAVALRMVMDLTGITLQDRDHEQADEHAENAAGIEEAAARLAECWRAIEVDALCPRAWYYIAKTLANDLGQLAQAALPMLLSALDQRHSEPWADAFLIALETGDEDFVNIVGTAAVDDVGDAFIDAVRRCTGGLPEDLCDTVLALAARICDNFSPRSSEFTLRTWDSDGNLEEIPFRRGP